MLCTYIDRSDTLCHTDFAMCCVQMQASNESLLYVVVYRLRYCYVRYILIQATAKRALYCSEKQYEGCISCC